MDWFTILVRCGCASMVAQNWAPVFAVAAGPERFSLGHEELDEFLAQILHESAMLTRLEEGLSYSRAERIADVWPSRFPSAAAAAPFVRNPEALANKVYGGRMGNDQPGDGWRFRGRGLIQVTGRANYTALAEVLGEPLVSDPGRLLRPELAVRSAVAWWEGNVPDGVMGDARRVRRAVNGGSVGLDDTVRIAAAARGALG
jgi:putative chitinase